MRTIETIKVADGNKVTYKGKTYIMTGNAQLWDLLGWDIKNDPNAQACADVIVRELICFGYIDLSSLCSDGSRLEVEIIPVGKWDEEVAKGGEIVGEVVR